MKKKILSTIFLIMLISVFFLSACKNKKITEQEQILTAERENEIKTACYVQYFQPYSNDSGNKDDVKVLCYLGDYDGKTAVFAGFGYYIKEMKEKNFELDRMMFHSDHYYAYLIYQNGKIYPIDEAFQSEIITKEELKKIYEKKLKIADIDSIEKSDASTQMRIKQAYYDKYTDEGQKEEYTAEQIRINSFLGNYDGKTVVCVGLPGIFPDVVENLKIGDYFFKILSRTEFLVYDGQDVFRLSEAFENKIIKDEEMFLIHQRYYYTLYEINSINGGAKDKKN